LCAGLEKRTGGLGGQGRGGDSSPGRETTFRPRLEVLEGRDVPSTLTVTNNLDNGSAGSLRYEIGQAHNKDTIVFAPSLDGQTINPTQSELNITKSENIHGPSTGLLTINRGSRMPSVKRGRELQAERNRQKT